MGLRSNNFSISWSTSIDGWELRCTGAKSYGPSAEVLAVPYPPPEVCALALVNESTEESPSVKSNTVPDACLLGRLGELGRLMEASTLSLRPEGYRSSVLPSALSCDPM
eukprot:1739826-Pyramimonas_sp.AAC.1